MMSNTMSFSTFVNGNYISIKHHIGQLSLNKAFLRFHHNICSMSLSPNKLFVVYSNIRHDDFHIIEDSAPTNNVEAFDFSGQLVWKIEDVWLNSKVLNKATKKHGLYFCSVYWHNAESLCDQFPNIQNELNEINTEFAIIKDHEYLECYTMDEQRVIIDLTDSEIKHLTGDDE